MKTGFTKKAGRCLVGAATRDGVTLICVTLNDGDEWNDHITAFDYGFEQTRNITLCEEGEISVPLKTPEGKTVFAKNSATLTAVTVGESDISRKVFAEKFVYPPKTAGDKVGEIVFYSNGIEVGRDSLCLDRTIEAPSVKKQFFLIRIFNIIKGIFKWQN